MPGTSPHAGSVRERPSGDWEGSISIDKVRYYTRGKTRAAAMRGINELRNKHARGELVAPAKTTLATYLHEWLAAGQAGWKPKTRKEYECVVRVYLVPTLGDQHIQKVTPALIAEALLTWQREREVSGGTLLNVYKLLSCALSGAVARGLVSRNPCDMVKPPRVVRRVPDLWTAEQATRFLNEDVSHPRYAVLWALLLGTGCRLGEVLGLRWEDIGEGAVSIKRTRMWIRGACVEGVPKTKAGTRVMSLPAWTMDALTKWREYQAEEQRLAGESWAGGGRVISLASGETPGLSIPNRRFEESCAALGLPRLRVHDLRHLSASVLLDKGMTLPELSKRLGHASVAVTAGVYAHALEGRDRGGELLDSLHG